MKHIGITMGDPKGIGPEIVAKAWGELSAGERSKIFIYGDRTVFDAACELAHTVFDHKHLVITSSTAPPMQQMNDSEAARIALSAIDAAIRDAAASRIAAMVTAPVNKSRISLAKSGFTGHTEYLAKAARAHDVVMMFAPPESAECEKNPCGLKRACFSLVTTHLPIKEVPAAITTNRILTTIRQTNAAMRGNFDRPDARIAVLSLNPHAGEGGMSGTEEKTIITPAISRAVSEGINCHGPFAADGLFSKPEEFDFDAVVAMYHDQALIPAKLICGGNCVNLSLGLPYVRTSPGHGTAEDIAWIGNADASGMIAAIRLAMRLNQF